jgi:hypothetical protein
MATNLLLLDVAPAPVRPQPAGLLRPEGRGVRDDGGRRRLLGVSLFWAVSGFKFERDRLFKNLDWAAERVDFVRILGDVTDWDTQTPPGTNIDATWPDYEEMLAGTLEAIATRGMRTAIACVGGGHNDPLAIGRRIANVCTSRRAWLAYLEACNEADAHGKITEADLVALGQLLRASMPDVLIALSRPKPTGDSDGRDRMKELMREVGGPMVFPNHTDRKDGDRDWRKVRQCYDFEQYEPWPASDQEGPPVQSVDGFNSPLQHAIKAFLAHMAGAPFYVVHLGAGTKGVPNPAVGRPANLYEVPEADPIIRAVRLAQALCPADLENWRVVNNGRNDHPLPLPEEIGIGFWEGDGDAVKGDLNKNYAALGPGGQFVSVLCGVNSTEEVGPRRVTSGALRGCHVLAIEPVTGARLEGDLAAGAVWTVPGRRDRNVGYLVFGSPLAAGREPDTVKPTPKKRRMKWKL